MASVERWHWLKGAVVLVAGHGFRDLDKPRLRFTQADLTLRKEAQRVAQVLPPKTLDMVIFTTGIKVELTFFQTLRWVGCCNQLSVRKLSAGSVIRPELRRVIMRSGQNNGVGAARDSRASYSL